MKSLLLNIIYYIFQHLFFSIIYIYIYLVDKYLYSLKGHKHRLHLRPFENIEPALALGRPLQDGYI
jgi:hypothetical protein